MNEVETALSRGANILLRKRYKFVEAVLRWPLDMPDDDIVVVGKDTKRALRYLEQAIGDN